MKSKKRNFGHVPALGAGAGSGPSGGARQWRSPAARRLTIPHAGGRPGGHPPRLRLTPWQGMHGAGRHAESGQNSLVPPGGGPRRWRGVSGRPAAAEGRSPRGVFCPSGAVASTVPQISPPLRGPCHLFRLRKGVFIKPQASLQSFPFPQPENPALWSHGEELRGTVQQRTSCTGSKQQLNGSESRGPVQRQLKTNPTRMGHH